MKQSFLIVLILVSLAANAVAGLMVPRLAEHSAETSLMMSHSSGSHHDQTDEKKTLSNNESHGDSQCHDTDECCIQLCHIGYAILQERIQTICSIPQEFDAVSAPLSIYLSQTIPYFPD